MAPNRHQAIIKIIAGLLSIEPLGTNCSEILINIQNFSVTKMHMKLSSAKRRQFCPGGDELIPGKHTNRVIPGIWSNSRTLVSILTLNAFWFEFHRSLFIKAQLSIRQHWFRLATNHQKKALPKPMLTTMCDTIWRHYVRIRPSFFEVLGNISILDPHFSDIDSFTELLIRVKIHTRYILYV